MTVSVKAPTSTTGSIQLNGSDVLTIDSSGNLTAPNNLTVTGNISTSGTIPASQLTGDVFVTDATQSELVYSTNGTDSPAKIYYNHSIGQLYFETNGSTKMKIHNNGNIAWATEGSAGFQYNTDADAGRPYFKNWVNSTATKNQFTFNNPNGEVGRITTSGTSTAYNTSSDYRLKENVTPMSGGIDRLKQLKPSTWSWVHGGNGEGFVAHEAQAVVPEAVTGTKDEVNDDGNPVYQGIDQSKLVPLLTAALQEAITKIEDLETRIQALESA